MTRRRITSFWHAVDGVTAVEFAIVAPVFLLLVFGCFEFGRAFWIWNTMQLAVDEGGRYGMVYGTRTIGPWGPSTNTCSTSLAQCAANYAKTQLYGLNATDFTVTGAQTGATGSATTTLTITATYTFISVVPTLLNLSPITLTRTSTVPLV
jgi:Flp pilus assembly protein TadG